MIVRDIYNKSVDYLKKYGIKTAKIDTEIFLSEIFNCSRMEIYLSFDKPMSENELERMRLFLKRRKAGEPIQYITQKAYFMGFDFFIKNGCFIPRFDTELLVEKIVDVAQTMSKPIRMLEIGGGSGAVAISIAKLVEGVYIDIVEKEKIPLEVINVNIEKQNVNDKINVIEGDFFELELKEKYDIIFSNPPYIAEQDTEIEDSVRKYEPSEALFAGKDGMDFYTRFFNVMRNYPAAYYFFEIGYDQKEKIENLFKKYETKFFRDLNGIDRVVEIKGGF